MAVAQGYGKTVTSGSVFAYDVADTRNSYRGEPTVNLIGNFVNTYNEDYWVRATNYYQLEATAYIVQDENAPGGAYTYVTGNTSDTNAQLFWSAGNTICNEFGQQVSVSAWLRGSGEVRLIAYDDTTGYKSGPAITLTDQWTYHKFSTTFGSGGTQANHWVGVREITTGEYVHVAQMQWERKSHATQYVRGTRSVTQGLLPLVGNSTIDLSNVSFDSNGQIVFDGTDDKIHDISVVHSYLNSSAIEFVVTPETIGRRMTIGGYRQNSGYSSPTIGMVYIESDNKFYASVITTAEVYRFVVSTTTIQANGTYHVVFNKDTSAGVMRLYVNGVAEGAQTFNAATYAQWSSAGSYIGSDIIDLGKSFNTNSGQGWGGDFLDGKIHNFKLYSRILTAQEIQSNYLQYKTRFNLS